MSCWSRASKRAGVPLRPYFAQLVARPFSNHVKLPEGYGHRGATVERELPDPTANKMRGRIYFGLFWVAMGASMYCLAKYEAVSSPIVSSTMYTLRRSPLASQVLGEDVRFASTIPWISGNPGIAGDSVKFHYRAKGTKSTGTVYFHADKIPGERKYRTVQWCIEQDDGTKIDLIDDDFHPLIPAPKQEPGMVSNPKSQN